jgi:hypothetical protein
MLLQAAPSRHRARRGRTSQNSVKHLVYQLYPDFTRPIQHRPIRRNVRREHSNHRVILKIVLKQKLDIMSLKKGLSVKKFAKMDTTP